MLPDTTPDEGEKRMSNASDRPAIPRAMVHKNILDAAADKPDASMAEIAAAVPSTNTDLVERVLEEYGDPADETPTPSQTGEHAMGNDSAHPDPEDLSEKQREALRAIYDHPEASQREIADLLDVSASTVSTRVNAIEGFEWTDRYTFATNLFDTPATTEDDSAPTSQNGADPEPSTDRLSARIDTIEHQLETLTDTNATGIGVDDLALVHKILHACMESDTITQDEELHIIEQLIH